jgi:hypothetical protein
MSRAWTYLFGIVVLLFAAYLFLGSEYMAPTEVPAPVTEEPGDEPGLQATLREAKVAFNAPERLQFREPSPIELVLSPLSAEVDPETLLSQGLPGVTRSEAGVDFALKMQATLSGPDFTVEPAGPQLRTVLDDRPTRWDWTVTPTRFGSDRLLTIELQAVLSQGDADLPPLYVRTFRESIDVDVTLWHRVASSAEEVTKVHAAIAGVGGTAAAVVAWLWARRRKRERERPDSIEVIVRHGRPEPPDRPQ